MYFINEQIPHLDFEQIKMMKNAFGDNFKEFIDVYVEDVKQLLNDMLKASEQNDLATLHRVAHSIKSASLNAGAMRLSQMAKEMEVDAKEDKLVNVKDKIYAIEHEFKIVQNMIKEENN